MKLINSCCVIPYNSTYNRSEENYQYQYWSLDDHFTIRSPLEFKPNDVVKIVSVDGNTINVVPVMDTKTGNNLVFVSNDIPLDSQYNYTFEYMGCKPLIESESILDGNKVFTIAALVENDTARIRGVCKENKTKILFNISNIGGM